KTSPQPETEQCILAPPISSKLTFSPITISAMRGDPKYIEALPLTIATTSQKAGMYAPPAADGPNNKHIYGTRPNSLIRLWKMRPAPLRPGNISTLSVIRTHPESTKYNIGISNFAAVSWMRIIFSTVLFPQEPALTVESLANTQTFLPLILQIPVTTPSAGSSSFKQLAK